MPCRWNQFDFLLGPTNT